MEKMDSFEEHDPLLPTTPTKQKQTTAYFFKPETPSQRSLMDIPPPPKPSCPTVIMMGCCPCAVGDPCSAEKKQEYKKVPKSISIVISLLQIIMFCIALGLGGFGPPRENWLLGPTNCILLELGAKQGYRMKIEYQVWRFFTPIVLHSGVIQLFINIFGQLRMGLFLERKWGWYVFFMIYLISGMAGISISCVLRPNSTGTAATAAFIGVLGAYLAQLQMTWYKLEGWQKRINVSICVLFIIITIAEGLGRNFVDTSANVGGLIIGMIQGYSIFGKDFVQRWYPRQANLVLFIGYFCILIYFIVTIAIFYTFSEIDLSTACEVICARSKDCNYYDY